ncbi:hypothetical protein ACIOJE_25930 [Kitasatospora sp. NPDC087861]|uniref:hypothetical protein n=1 Tax=Kitasatospora sp. NPDC087861 TaxID=3364070 RepID=UPI00382B8315
MALACSTSLCPSWASGRATADQRRAAADAFDDLVAVLALGGITLPSAGVDWRAGRLTGSFLIELGATTPEMIVRLVELLRSGLRQEQREAAGGS